jgi:hypothetical protein
MKMSWLPVALLLALSVATGCHVRYKAKTGNPPPAPTANPAAAAALVPALTPQENLVQQAINLLDRATNLFTSITDKASATKAAPELKTIAQQLQGLNRRGVPLGSQVQENPQAAGRLKGELEKAIQRYAEAAVHKLAQDNLLGTEFQGALAEFGKLPQ